MHFPSRIIASVIFLYLAASCSAQDPPSFDLKTAVDAAFGPGKRFDAYLEDLREHFSQNGALQYSNSDEEQRQATLAKQHICRFQNVFAEKYNVYVGPHLAFVQRTPVFSQVRMQSPIQGDLLVAPCLLMVNQHPIRAKPVTNELGIDIPTAIRPHVSLKNQNPSYAKPVANKLVVNLGVTVDIGPAYACKTCSYIVHTNCRKCPKCRINLVRASIDTTKTDLNHYIQKAGAPTEGSQSQYIRKIAADIFNPFVSETELLETIRKSAKEAVQGNR